MRQHNFAGNNNTTDQNKVQPSEFYPPQKNDSSSQEEEAEHTNNIQLDISYDSQEKAPINAHEFDD